jgi:hypothetical protein
MFKKLTKKLAVDSSNFIREAEIEALFYGHYKMYDLNAKQSTEKQHIMCN